MRIRSILLAGSLCAAGPALAQDSPPSGAPGTGSSDTGAPGTGGMAPRTTPMGNVGQGGQTGATLSKTDREFVKKAAEGGLFEVKVAQLALDKTKSDTVRTFAQHMVDDHGRANDQLKTIAQQKNIPVPTEMSSDQQSNYDKLSKLSGDEFDRAYMKRMVDDHNDDVSLFQKEASDGKDADLKSFARQTLPTIKQHDDMAKRDRRML